MPYRQAWQKSTNNEKGEPKTRVLPSREHVVKSNQLLKSTTATTRISILGAFIVIILAVTDRLIMEPIAVPVMIIIRAAMATYMLFVAYICIILSKRSEQKWAQSTFPVLYALSSLMTCATVASIIPYTGNYQSPHYLAITLSAIMFTVIPCFSHAALITMWATHAFSYPIPLYLRNPAGAGTEFYITVVLHLTIVTALTMHRHRSDKDITSNLYLEYDKKLYQEKLDEHTQQLDRQVREQTAQIEKHLRHLDTLFHTTTDGIILMEQNQTIIAVNEAACQMHHYDKEALIGTAIDLLIPDSERRSFNEKMAIVANGTPLTYEITHYTKKATSILCEVSATSFESDDKRYIQINCRDITDRKMLEKRIAQQEKLESIAIAASGIAHDVKNTLMAANTFIELTREHPEWETLDAIAPDIEETIMKSKDTIDRLLELNKPRPKAFAPYNINDIVRKAYTCTKFTLKHSRVKVALQLEEKLPHSLGNHSDLEDAMINLIVNAKDAMPNGGNITIRTSLVQPQARPHGTDQANQQFLSLSIKDTGTGIPQEIREKIFNPYFTTKPRLGQAGSGTGLGLFNVYTTIKDHSGTIYLETSEETGTKFTMMLPVQQHNTPWAKHSTQQPKNEKKHTT